VADTRAEPLFAAVAAVQRLLVVAASRSRLRARCHGFASSNRDVRFGSSTSFQAQAAHFRLYPDWRTCCCVAPLGDQSADPRRGPPHGGELREAARAAAPVATNRRDVTRSQPHIHDSPRNVRLAPVVSNSRRNTLS